MAGNLKDLGKFLEELISESSKYESCMSLIVSEEGGAVTLFLDTTIDYYGDSIPGEGADICLYRAFDDDRVVGCRLPLMNKRLAVSYEGPMRVNCGFRKSEPAATAIDKRPPDPEQETP